MYMIVYCFDTYNIKSKAMYLFYFSAEYPHRGYTNLPESFSPTLTSKPETAVNGNTPDLQKPAQT